jgi:Prealbumin-like fold domain
MRDRILGPTGGWRRRRLLVPLLLVAVVGLALGIVNLASAGPVGTAAGFEDDDGNLAVDSTFDWNGFSAATWTGTAPFRTSSLTASGWAFTGLEDAQATTSDTAFAGGTKQDDDCASVITQKADNKADLKRYYVAHKTVNGHEFLELAWIRITQNTTSPSAHVAFEFNKGSSACPAGSDGLVHRSDGDMLIVYDFEGGSTDLPTLRLERWTTDSADSCEVGSHDPPCWGPAQVLTDPAGCISNTPCAEGKVNTTATALDEVAPSNETLGLSEFGEAGIDLTDAGVVTTIGCGGFGKTYAVSRTSGNSATAQMKDLVGPGNLATDCGALKVTKTSTKGNAALAGATFEVKDPNGVVIKDPNGNSVWTTGSDGTFCVSNLPIANGYTVQEKSAPTGYKINDTTVRTVNVTGAGTCTSGAATASFTDTPLSTVEVKFTSLAGTGVTTSQIVCKQGTTVVAANSENGSADDETTPVRDDTDEVFGNGTSGLEPGVYTCTIDIDP